MKSLLMSPEMIKAYGLGIKWQTRRLVTPQPDGTHVRTCRCKVGDQIYLRETWYDCRKDDPKRSVIYRADESVNDDEMYPVKWRPSLLMPEWAARYRPTVIDIGWERVQNISEEDAFSEGIGRRLGKSDSVYGFRNYQFPENHVSTFGLSSPRESYRTLWNSLHLEPKPVKVKGQLVGYRSFPWSEFDFETYYRSPTEFKGKPLQIIANPWVWKIELSKP